MRRKSYFIRRIYWLAILLLPLVVGCKKQATTGDCPSDSSIFLPEAPEGYCWEKAFQDDFIGTELDSNQWIIWNGDRAESISRKEAVSLGGGNLVIRQFYDSVSGKYVSAFVGTLGKFEQAYGFYSACLRVNKITGWDAGFWLIGQNVGKVDNSGVDGSEIDIIEMPFQNDDLLHAIHWDGYGPEQKLVYKIVTRPDIRVGAFHTFSVWWNKDEYIFYIDGKESWRSSGGGVSQDATTYMILSSEVNTALAGPISPTGLPVDYLVDWVRVYNLVPE